MKEETVKTLQKAGVYLQSGGFNCDPVSGMFGRSALCAIWHMSEEPTSEEMRLLRTLPAKIAETWWNQSALKDNYSAEGANTITLYKKEGAWTYRRMTWRTGPTWHQPADTLQNIIDSEIFRR